MNIARAVLFVLFVAIVPSFLIVHGQDYEWCMYRFYNHTKSWFDAKAICEQNNMTLAYITDDAQSTYLRDLMISSLPHMYANPPSSVWLGAYRAAGEKAKWQNDCGDVPTKYINGGGLLEACFLLAGKNHKLQAATCNDEFPFVCQASALDNATCFTAAATIVNAKLDNGAFTRPSPTDCIPSCTNSNCVGFRFIPSSSECKLMTYVLGVNYTKGGTDKYIKDLLRTTPPEDVTASISRLQDVCPSPMTTTTYQAPHSPSSSTVDPASLEFSSPETTTVDTRTSTLMNPASLESSSPETTTVVDTSSESTPPLPSFPTSVNLAQTSLPTAPVNTETISPTCSSCPCVKTTPIDQSQLEESISKLKEQLTIDPKTLSSYKRKLTSAHDDRQSAANIGYVGILVICLIPGIIILLDMGRLMREFKQFTLRVRNAHRANANVAPLDRT